MRRYAFFSRNLVMVTWRDKSQPCKCRNSIGGNSIAHAVSLCKWRCEKYCFRLIHFCPSLCLQVLFDECERMLHWFSYWFWWHFSVVSRFPRGEGRWTLFDIWFYLSVLPMEGRPCFLLFLSFFFLFFGGEWSAASMFHLVLLMDMEFAELGGPLHHYETNKWFPWNINRYLLLVVLLHLVLLCGLEVSFSYSECVAVSTLVGSACPRKSPAVAEILQDAEALKYGCMHIFTVWGCFSQF